MHVCMYTSSLPLGEREKKMRERKKMTGSHKLKTRGEILRGIHTHLRRDLHIHTRMYTCMYIHARCINQKKIIN